MGLFLGSCSNYRLSRRVNPLKEHDIKKLFVPNFYNQSLFPQASTLLGKEFKKQFARLKGLEIVGRIEEADAALVGVVFSPLSSREAMQVSFPLNVNLSRGDTNRKGSMLVPAQNILNLELQLFVVKDPTREDLEFLNQSVVRQKQAQKKLSKNAPNEGGRGSKNQIGKVLYQHSKPIGVAINRQLYSTAVKSNNVSTRDLNMAVNFTQSRGAIPDAIERVGPEIASEFMETLFFAF